MFAVHDSSAIAGTAGEIPNGQEIPLALEEQAPLATANERVGRAAASEFQFVWRVIRRLGIRPDASVDDAVQRVFEIAARKAESIAVGAERGFLFKTAVLVAAEERRRQRRARDRTSDVAPELASPDPNPEAMLEQRRNRERLDDVLDALPEKLRSVFVLYELEGLTAAEIAGLLGVPNGTVASRLRRARERFHAAAQRLRAQLTRERP